VKRKGPRAEQSGGDAGPDSERTRSPDILLFGSEWRPRALLRAQLIEEGFDVLAVESGSMMLPHFRPDSQPGLVVVDLQALADPARVLHDLREHMRPDRVLVIGAIGTMRAEEIEQLGFRVLRRPVLLAQVVAAAREAMAVSR
jgi:DNA-binding response OmpR family regulator